MSTNGLQLQSLSHAIQFIGFDVMGSLSTHQALHVLKHQMSAGNPVKLLIIDLYAAEDQIYDFLEQHHDKAELSHTKIALMVNNHDELEKLNRFNDLYISRLLLKPVKHSELHKLLSDIAEQNSGESKSAGVEVPDHPSQAVSKIKVLIAEDHAINQEVIKAILKHHGFDFSIVDNGLQALELTAQEDFDVILMDMQMPIMDGCQAAREIRQREQATGKHVRIIALTANAMKGDREICMAAGMDDYITKPIDSQVLVAKLNSESIETNMEDAALDYKMVANARASILNQESLQGRVLGQSIVSTKMANMFLTELPNTLANLDEAFKDQHFDAIAKLAHRMGGVAAMLGAEQFALIAEELEADAQVGAVKGISDCIQQLHITSGPLEKELMQLIDKTQ
jgi:CheY-like chemotaxis protein